VGLFDESNDESGDSSLFEESSSINPNEVNDLADSPEDLEGMDKLRQLRRIALFALLSLAVIMGSGIFLKQLRSNSTTDAPKRASGQVPPSSGSPGAGGASTPSTASTAGVGSSQSILGDAITSVALILVGDGNEFCASGSGFAVGDGTLLVTNNHVIESSPDCLVNTIEILVTTDPSREPEPRYFGDVLWADPKTDLAVLKLTDENGVVGRMNPLRISSRQVEVGETLQIIGFPGIGGFTVTVTQGNIAGFVSDDDGEWLKTDASISGGNSGGAAIDSNGELIAVPTRAGGGGRDVVDCRDFDTNHDGQINDLDSCIPIGGFLNLLRPADYVARAISNAK
jgi:S1-C subfamily serine protease